MLPEYSLLFVTCLVVLVSTLVAGRTAQPTQRMLAVITPPTTTYQRDRKSTKILPFASLFANPATIGSFSGANDELSSHDADTPATTTAAAHLDRTNNNNNNNNNMQTATTTNSTSQGMITRSTPRIFRRSPSSGMVAVAHQSLSSPRSRAVIYMACSMALHLGGYEFIRSAGLALLTSHAGFADSIAIAFPLTNVLVSPLSVGLLWIYTKQLHQFGPRETLRRSISFCVTTILMVVGILQGSKYWKLHPTIVRSIIGAAFLFQNAYASMLTSQQWSFMDSIVTPTEGANWFGALTGISSVVCTITASMISFLVPVTGVVGLYSLTALSLIASLLFADQAYAVAQQYGFDPSVLHSRGDERHQSTASKNEPIRHSERTNYMSNILRLFQRVPTLRALFVEGLVYQSFSTIINVATVRALQETLPNDAARSTLTGNFYAWVNGVSAVCQFIVLPMAMQCWEVKHIWRGIPVLPLLATFAHYVVSVRATNGNTSLLAMLAVILFVTQVTDYSVRSVIYNMAYQPLDYESRYVGKEFIGVFANRLGRSGMSLLLTSLTAIIGLWNGHVGYTGVAKNSFLSYLAIMTCALWMASTWWLSNLLHSKAISQQIVEERQKQQHELIGEQQPTKVD
jgi:ATP/ADP translocase